MFFCGKDEFLEDIGFVMFAFFNVIWATLYLESWKRRSAELAFEWGTSDQRPELLSESRPLYKVRNVVFTPFRGVLITHSVSCNQLRLQYNCRETNE